MKLAIISDIHSNLESLDRVIEKLDVDMILCCGDIVGYYSWPNECMRRLFELKIPSVIGNHDLACLTGDTTGFNPYAEQVLIWTRKIIEKENIRFLNTLNEKIRLKIDGAQIVLVHGSPRDPINEYIFPYTSDTTLKAFLTSENADILIMGHTHMPFVKKFGDYLVLNPGSIGQPRDGNKKASFIILNTEKRDAAIKRVRYNIDRVVTALKNEKLPSILGKRLYHGL